MVNPFLVTLRLHSICIFRSHLLSMDLGGIKGKQLVQVGICSYTRVCARLVEVVEAAHLSLSL